MTEVLTREGETAANGGEPNVWFDRNGEPIDLLEIQENGNLDTIDSVASSVADNSSHVKELAGAMRQEEIDQLRAMAKAEASRRIGLSALATEVQIEAWRQQPHEVNVETDDYIEPAIDKQSVIETLSGADSKRMTTAAESGPIGATEWHRTKRN